MGKVYKITFNCLPSNQMIAIWIMMQIMISYSQSHTLISPHSITLLAHNRNKEHIQDNYTWKYPWAGKCTKTLPALLTSKTIYYSKCHKCKYYTVCRTILNYLGRKYIVQVYLSLTIINIIRIINFPLAECEVKLYRNIKRRQQNVFNNIVECRDIIY